MSSFFCDPFLAVLPSHTSRKGLWANIVADPEMYWLAHQRPSFTCTGPTQTAIFSNYLKWIVKDRKEMI